MTDLKSRIMSVMRKQAKDNRDRFGGDYPSNYVMATINVRFALEREDPNIKWTSKDIRKALEDLSKDRLVSKDAHHSARNSTAWRLEAE